MLDCTVVSLFITRERVETVEPERRKAMPWPLKKQKKKKKKIGLVKQNKMKDIL